MATDLLICETILGVLRSRDPSGNSIIHGSDFKKAIDDLGLPWGSPVIDEIMMHCQRESDGYINFGPLADFLTEERDRRSILQSKASSSLGAKTQGKTTSSSLKVPPFRIDTANKERFQAERQSRLLQQYRLEVQDLYRRYCHHEIMIDDLIQELQTYDIYPTRAFNILVNKTVYDMTFVEFVKALTTPDNGADDAPVAGFSSQAMHYRRNTDDDYNLFGTRLRKISQSERNDSKHTQDGTTGSLSNLLGLPKTISPSKVVQLASSSIHGAYAAQGTTKESVNLKSSEQVRSSLFNDKSATPQLFSASQGAMIVGLNGGGGSGNGMDPSEVALTSEHKLLREQVLAALRRYRAREITLGDFQERVYKLGFELTDEILLELRRAEYSGELDYKKCVNLFDTNIFKDSALFDVPSPDYIDNIKSILLSKLSTKGSSSILALQRTFQEMDEDNSNSLSFNEFLKSCRSLNIPRKEVSDEDLRALFVSFDKNGDGELQYDEFMESLRGTLNPNRRKIVQNAFLKLDSRNRKALPLSEIVKAMVVSYHPDVVSGRLSEEKTLSDMIDFFTVDEENPKITMEDFIEYYSNISPFVESDNEFIRSVKATWNMSNMVPAPPIIVPHSTHGVSENKDGKQVIFRNQAFNTQISSGDIITWTQEQSQFEALGKVKGLTKRHVETPLNAHKATKVSQSFYWAGVKPEEVNEALHDEFRAVGGNMVSSHGMTNKMRGSIKLEWKHAKPTTAPSSMISVVNDPHENSSQHISAAAFGYQPPGVAGAPLNLGSSQRKFVAATYGIQSKRMAVNNQHWTGGKPYGTDEPNDDENDSDLTDDTPKSLAEVLKSKKQNKDNDLSTNPWKQMLAQPEPKPKTQSLSLAEHMTKVKLGQ